VSPERLLTPWFLETVERLRVRAFAIDEAHCISHWGHDFRPEYRQLALLKQRIPGSSLHAYTATATDRVREDIADQLGLVNPALLVGNFDRPNLVYRLIPRLDLRRQVSQILERHRGQGTIAYCISRKDTERLASWLHQQGHRAEPYHAGMEAERRHRTQEAFANEQVDIVVATVAFGMGIDRSDIRCVIHAACPKSVEHYQQETGRAGRDGLEAECVLLHSPADTMRWQSVLERGAAESGAEPGTVAGPLGLLRQMRRFVAPDRCRHRALVEYFGQTYEPTNEDGCGACDVCLGETEGWIDGSRDAQILLSCVARVDQAYGMGHVVDVVRGADTERIRTLGHQELSTWGLLRERTRKELMHLTYQLLDQEVLGRSEGEYPVLRLNEASLQVLRGERTVRLIPARAHRARTSATETEAWEGVDRDLFERLRKLRTRLAREREVAPYLIFSDASLRDMARRRPHDETEFLQVHGVGDKKLADLGPTFLACIAETGDDSCPGCSPIRYQTSLVTH